MIEVNEYVRTKDGVIGKVIKVLSNRVFLNSLGYKVIRFWNNEIYENIDGVLLRLSQEIYPHQEI